MRVDKVEELSVFLPAYNEEQNILKVIKNVKEVLKKIAKNYEIIVIDDGSVDNTAQKAKEIPQVRLISHSKNLGYGAALKTGFYNAKYKLISFMDSDLQFDFKEINKFLDYIEDYDLVIGFRKNRADNLVRKLNARTYSLLLNLLFNLNVHDVDCGFKLVKKDIFKVISLQSNGALVSAELLIKARKNGFKIKEVEVNHFPRIAGKQTGANPKVILKTFLEIAKLRRSLN